MCLLEEAKAAMAMPIALLNNAGSMTTSLAVDINQQMKIGLSSLRPCLSLQQVRWGCVNCRLPR